MKDKGVSLSDIPRKFLKKKSRETNEPNADNSGFNRNSLLAIINNTNDANWSVDRDYKLINFNNAFSKMVKSMSGKTVGNGSDFFALGFTDKELARYKELYDYAFAGKEIAITEYNELPVMSWAELSFCPIRVGVEVVGAACNVHNVTESKFTEEKTINARRLYEFISQTNQAITHTKDEKMLFLKVCNIAVDIGKFGLSWIGVPNVENKKIDVIAHNTGACSPDISALYDLVYDDDGPTAHVLRSGEYYVINDFRHQPINSSSYIYASQRGYRSLIILPIKKQGKVIATLNLLSARVDLFDEQELRLLKESAYDISFALDVFEKDKRRKQMEDEIIQSVLRMKQAQAIAHLGSWELNFSTGLGKWSEESCRIYELTLEDNILSHQSWVSYIHPDDLDYVLRIIKEGETTLGGFAFHHRILLKNGEVKHIYSEAHFEFNTNGEAVGLYGIAQDVTKSKLLENERARIVADILQRNSDLEQFSYIVSHNIRAPLANILGLVNIIQTAGIDKEEKEVIEFLAFASKNLDNVIMDINQILELKHSVQELKEHLLFEDLLSELRMGIDCLLNAEKVDLVGDFSEAPEIYTVKKYLYSIFINLITNSIKYRKPGISPIISVHSRKINNRIQLSFKDNGLGIDIAKEGDKVFGLYKRFHYHVAGKGMGLFMVKYQAELLGGKITVSSEVNIGTEFCISFE